MLAKDKSHLVSLKVHIQCNISFSCSKSPHRHFHTGSVENLNGSRINRHGNLLYHRQYTSYFLPRMSLAGLWCFLRSLTLIHGQIHRLSLCLNTECDH